MALNDERWDSHRHEHDRERDATQTAAKALDSRLAGLNEFRLQLGDQSKTFVTRELHDALSDEVERRVNAVLTDMDRRFEVDRRNISQLQADNSKLQGALAIARFVGFGGFLTALSAVIWIIVHGGSV